MVLKLKHVHLSQHVGAPLHGLWGIPPGCLHQECSASDLRVQLRDLCRERRGYGPAEVCGKCRCVRVCVLSSHVSASVLPTLFCQLCTTAAFLLCLFLIPSVSGFGSMTLKWILNPRLVAETNVVFGQLPTLHLRMNTIVFVGSFTTPMWGEEWMTKCTHEHFFVLWELLNDRLLTYICAPGLVVSFLNDLNWVHLWLRLPILSL